MSSIFDTYAATIFPWYVTPSPPHPPWKIVTSFMDGPKGKDKNMVENDNGGHDTNKNDDDITYKATIVSILMD